VASDQDSPELADSLTALSAFCRRRGKLERAREVATQGVAMWRRLGGEHELIWPLFRLAICQQLLGDFTGARNNLEEALALSRDCTDNRVARALSELAYLEAMEHHFERSLELDTEAVRISREFGDELHALRVLHNIGCTLREMGRLEQAQIQMRAIIPALLRLADPEWLILLAEDYAALLAELGSHERAIRLLGAADARRDKIASPRSAAQQAEIAEPLSTALRALSKDAWGREHLTGRTMSLEDALQQAYATSASPAC
jgi:tetratricopeptide (TPR) repeat protein